MWALSGLNRLSRPFEYIIMYSVFSIRQKKSLKRHHSKWFGKYSDHYGIKNIRGGSWDRKPFMFSNSKLIVLLFQCSCGFEWIKCHCLSWNLVISEWFTKYFSFFGIIVVNLGLCSWDDEKKNNYHESSRFLIFEEYVLNGSKWFIFRCIFCVNYFQICEPLIERYDNSLNIILSPPYCARINTLCWVKTRIQQFDNFMMRFMRQFGNFGRWMPTNAVCFSSNSRDA